MDKLLTISIFFGVFVLYYLFKPKRKERGRTLKDINSVIDDERYVEYYDGIDFDKEKYVYTKSLSDDDPHDYTVRTIDAEQVMELYEESVQHPSFNSTSEDKEEKKKKLVFFKHKCYWCKKESFVWWLFDGCNPIHIRDSFKQLFFDEILQKFWKYKDDNNLTDLNIGEIRLRKSKTMEQKYKSFGCYHCGGLLGINFVYENACNISDAELNSFPNFDITIEKNFHFNPSDPQGILSEKQMYHIYKCGDQNIKDKIFRGDYDSGRIFLNKYFKNWKK